jgi:hypothetical protein
VRLLASKTSSFITVTMQVRLWAWTAAILATVQAASDTQEDTTGAFVDGQGVTHIYGNSFGRPGYNETYDYIVSLQFPLCKCLFQAAL